MENTPFWTTIAENVNWGHKEFSSFSPSQHIY